MIMKSNEVAIFNLVRLSIGWRIEPTAAATNFIAHTSNKLIISHGHHNDNYDAHETTLATDHEGQEMVNSYIPNILLTKNN